MHCGDVSLGNEEGSESTYHGMPVRAALHGVKEMCSAADLVLNDERDDRSDNDAIKIRN